MNIVFLTKYPPIEGGTASRAYWLIRGLASKGHKIFVITNANDVEKDYRIDLDKSDRSFLKSPNIILLNVDSSSVPHYIPEIRPDVTLLANKALQVIQKNKIDIICSWYLLPYGLAGMIISKITGVPYIVKHAGSDLGRLLQSFSISNILFQVLKQANLIITNKERERRFLLSGIKKNNLFISSSSYGSNKKFFNKKPPSTTDKFNKIFSNKIPVISFFGKLNRTKGVGELIKAASLVKNDFKLLIVSSSERKELDVLINLEKMKNRVIRIPFVAPWEMPYLIQKSTCVVIPERDFPIKHHISMLVSEVMTSGKCLVLSDEVYNNVDELGCLKNKENVISVNVKNIPGFARALNKVISDKKFRDKIGENAYKITREGKDKHNVFIEDFIKACRKTLGDSQEV